MTEEQVVCVICGKPGKVRNFLGKETEPACSLHWIQLLLAHLNDQPHCKATGTIYDYNNKKEVKGGK